MVASSPLWSHHRVYSSTVGWSVLLSVLGLFPRARDLVAPLRISDHFCGRYCQFLNTRKHLALAWMLSFLKDLPHRYSQNYRQCSIEPLSSLCQSSTKPYLSPSKSCVYPACQSTAVVDWQAWVLHLPTPPTLHTDKNAVSNRRTLQEAVRHILGCQGSPCIAWCNLWIATVKRPLNVRCSRLATYPLGSSLWLASTKQTISHHLKPG